MDVQNKQAALCGYLRKYHTGGEKAVPSHRLEAVFSMKGSEIRRYVNLLRCEGVPICSGESGYYYASTYEELEATVRQLNSRIEKIAMARNGIIAGGGWAIGGASDI